MCILNLICMCTSNGVCICHLSVLFYWYSVAQTDQELSIGENEQVTIVEILGDGWMNVRKGDRMGFVPESYVRIGK